MKRVRVMAIAPLSAGILAAAAFVGVSLKIGNETEPPNGVVQLKAFITEPKPISTGGGKFAMDASAVDDILGIALFSTAGDASGAAVVRGTDIQMTYFSPTASFGMSTDYPVISIAGHVRADAPIGYKASLTIDPAAVWFLNPFGGAYAFEVNPGQLIVAPGVSVTNVTPGSAVVPAGGVVTLHGVNFHPLSTVRFKETKLAEVRYVDPTRIDVVLAATTRMHGQHIKVSNPDGSSSTYFSYQRTVRAGASTHALLNATYPLFVDRQVNSATFVFLPDTAHAYAVIAVQNTQATQATVTLSRISPTGEVLDSAAVLLAPNSRLVRAATEFLSEAATGGLVRVDCDVPLQILGLAADENADSVRPLSAVALR